MKTNGAMEAAAKAIWNTWRASRTGKETAPAGGALSWDEMLLAVENEQHPALAEMIDLSRQEASAAISAYEHVRQKQMSAGFSEADLAAMREGTFK